MPFRNGVRCGCKVFWRIWGIVVQTIRNQKVKVKGILLDTELQGGEGGQVTLPPRMNLWTGTSNTPLQPLRWENKSPQVAWEVVSPHQRQEKRTPYLQHRISRGRPSDRFLFAGYMRGELRASNAGGSISIGQHRTELQPLQKWVSERGYKLMGGIYLSYASSVWKDTQ